MIAPEPTALTALSRILSGPAVASLMQEVTDRARGERKAPVQVDMPTRFSVYRDDPVGFARDVLGTEVTRDIERLMASVRDNVVTIAKSGNAVGKTHSAAHLAIWFWAVFPEAQVYTTAAPPERNLRQLLWGEIGKIVARNNKLFADNRVAASMHIERSSSEFVTGLTIPAAGSEAEREARFSGKHAPHMLFIVDEGDAVPDPVYRGIESCMSGGHVRLLIMFNPRAKSGPVYRAERSRQAKVVQISALTHPNVTSGLDVIPGAVSRAITVRRIHEWTRALTENEEPDDRCFEVPLYLVGATAERKDGSLYPPLEAGWRRVVDSQFSYMVQADYPAQAADQLINEDDVWNARARWDAYVAKFGERPPIGVRPILGADVAELGQDSNAGCLRYGGWVAPLHLWSGVDIKVTGEKVADLATEYDAIRICIDATGVGAGVAPVTRDHLRKRKNSRVARIQAVKVATTPTEKTEFGTFGLLRDQLWWTVREWLRTDTGAMLPPDEDLIEELLVPNYRVVGNDIKIMDKVTMRQKLGRSPDRADALCMTFAPRGRTVRVGFAGSDE